MAQYYLGLDIGTQSVGWAVTDLDYKIIKKHGKALWGVRLFNEAQPAQDRRAHRVQRRRYQRRKQRLAWLEQVFNPHIAQADPAFFQRMEESKYCLEDKKSHNGVSLGKYTLFTDKDFCDKDYYKAYPTIYHLRKALIEKDGPFDVRLVYLAIHHIMKKRGHFLLDGEAEESYTFEKCLEELKSFLLNEYQIHFSLSDEAAFSSALCDRTLSPDRKKKALKALVNLPEEKQEQVKAVVDFMAGAKVKPSNLLDKEFPKEEDKTICLKEKFDENEGAYIQLFGDDMELIYRIKALYDWSVLDALKSGQEYISFAKVQQYDQHKKDLIRLKNLLRPYRAVYKEVFSKSQNKLNNYVAYSGHRADGYRCNSYEDFSKYLKKQLDSINQEGLKEEIAQIKEELEAGVFLSKPTTKDDGVIPHQLHEQELRLILRKAENYLPFLKEMDESGLTLSQRIIEVFRFRIPYYVGPLNKASSHAWLERTDEKILPWNFENVVDVEASAEKFITRMTALCSYTGMPVLPKDSLLYSRYNALNIINKLQINGHPISVETKQQIYTGHILPRGKTNMSALKNYLLKEGLMEKGDILGGVDEQFRISLESWCIFARILKKENAFPVVEEIIRRMVLFGGEPRLLENWLKKTCGHILSPEDRRYVMQNRTRFKDWGSLSGEFLTQVRHCTPEGDISILDALWQTNHNLMELLSGQFTFARQTEALRMAQYGEEEPTLDELLQESYTSPAIRRGIRQAVELVDEIERIMGGQPQRVFVEVTRGEGVKERTVSRKNRLLELYKACGEQGSALYAQLENCTESQLRSKKLYLYYTQMAKCMYSGKDISLSELETHYDIDHIRPRSKVKDDSLDNLVLVERQLNAQKSDTYPIHQDIRKNMGDFWRALRAKNLISQEKYQRLTRNTPFDENEQAGFIARQLVETGQSAKFVAQLLKRRYPGSDRVVYVKAGTVSDFRNDQRIAPDGTQWQRWQCKNIETVQDPLFIKCREVNDLHHAKDAYLNIVVGNVYHARFTANPLHYIRREQHYNLNRVFAQDIAAKDGFAWQAGEDGSIATVRRTMAKNNILVTRFAYKVGGELFKQTIMPKGRGQAMIKSGDPRMAIEKYGGYDKIRGAWFALVEHTEKKKRVRSLEPVYIMHRAFFEQDPAGYCRNILDLKDPRVLVPCIRVDSLVSMDGFRMYVSGRQGRQIIYKNANQLVLSPEQIRYIKRLSGYVERCRKIGEQPIYPVDKITAQENCALYRTLVDKLNNSLYGVKYATPAQTLTQHYGAFQTLSCEDQCQVLMQIMHLFATTAASADLKKLCGKAGIGILLTSKNMDNMTGRRFCLIHQSVTGVFERQIDLLGDEF